MVATDTADNTALSEAADENRIAATHIMFGAGFLALGGVFQLLSLMALRFADIFPLPYGRFEVMGNLALMFGFGFISLIGGLYYVLPRLTGTKLWGGVIAGRALYATALLVVAGLVIVLFGWGEGRQPLGVPWWFHIPMVFLSAIPAVITIGTLANRSEDRSYVTVWYVLGGVSWLPLLYLTYFAGEIPTLSSITIANIDVFFSAGFVTMFLITVGTGLFYYTMVKELDVPLASRQLALVGFWSLGFAAVWWGTAQLLFGPGPDWVAGVGAALGLAFPIGALANAVNASLTLEGSWADVRDNPAVSAGVNGLYLAVGVGSLAALAGFRSIASFVSLTAFWEAIEYTAVTGVGTLLIASASFGALPRLTGRELHSKGRARLFIRLTMTGSVGVLVSLGASGIVSGFSWIGGSNAAAYVDAAEGWGAGLGASVETLLLIAIGFAVVTLLGQLTYVGTIFGTVTMGRATTQEMLISGEDLDE